MTRSCRVLLVDDEPAVRFGVRDFLESHGFDVSEAGDRSAARESFAAARPDAVVLDYRLHDGDSLELLAWLKETDAGVPVLILTGHGSIDLAVRAVKEGADQFLTKPVDLPALRVILDREIDKSRTRRRNLARQRHDDRAGGIDPFVGTSAVIQRLRREAESVLDSTSSVLIRGETGAGKGVLAKWLHSGGPRAQEPFVDLNCAGLSRDLLESELFGHQKGAFTGAIAAKQGLLEVGDGGTVFLDEIGDLDVQIQPKLLTVLEEKRFRRVGEVQDRRVDIRLIAATNQDLAALVREKRFRGDLYFRINTLELVVPPLRERREDVPALAERILARLTDDLGRHPVGLSAEALDKLMQYGWPGNVRELRNVLERALLVNRAGALQPSDLRLERSVAEAGGAADRAIEVGDAQDGAGDGDDASYDSALSLEDVQRRHIERVLKEEGGRVERAAARLGIARSSLYQKIKQYGLGPGEGR